MLKRPKITLAQEQTLERQLTLARAVAPVAFSDEAVKYQKRRAGSVRIIGTTEQYVFTSSVAVASGRFLSSGESEGGRPGPSASSVRKWPRIFFKRRIRWVSASRLMTGRLKSLACWNIRAAFSACSASTTR